MDIIYDYKTEETHATRSFLPASHYIDQIITRTDEDGTGSLNRKRRGRRSLHRLSPKEEEEQEENSPTNILMCVEHASVIGWGMRGFIVLHPRTH